MDHGDLKEPISEIKHAEVGEGSDPLDVPAIPNSMKPSFLEILGGLWRLPSWATLSRKALVDTERKSDVSEADEDLDGGHDHDLVQETTPRPKTSPASIFNSESWEKMVALAEATPLPDTSSSSTDVETNITNCTTDREDNSEETFDTLKNDSYSDEIPKESAMNIISASASHSISTLLSEAEFGNRKWYQRIGRRAILERFALRNIEMFDAGPSNLRYHETPRFYETSPNEKGQIYHSLKLFDIYADLKTFVQTPVAIGIELNCRIFREKRGLGLFPLFYMHLELASRNILILTARKRKICLGLNYLISIDPSDLRRHGEAHVATVRSNWFATKFTILEGRKVSKHREELGGIVYDNDDYGDLGPRKMRIFLPAMLDESRHIKLRPSTRNEGILYQGKHKILNGSIVELENKVPVWNSRLNAFTLDFGGRARQASVSNFQLVHEEDEAEIICQFCQIDKNTFNLDFRYPLCPLQAFSLAISSLSSRTKLLVNGMPVASV